MLKNAAVRRTKNKRPGVRKHVLNDWNPFLKTIRYAVPPQRAAVTSQRAVMPNLNKPRHPMKKRIKA
jgi:hypothetical protein